MSEVVDVAIETNEGNFYQFLSVLMSTLLQAIERIGSGEVLSMVNLDSAAIVVPSYTIRKIQVVSVLVEARDESSWSIVWKRPLEEKPKKIRKPRRKATHG